MKIKQLILTLIMITGTLLIAFPNTRVYANELTLQIPSIDVNAQILHAPLMADYSTWDVSHLYQTAGHLEMTPWFGQEGNVVVVAHSVALNGTQDIFYHLDQVQVGEQISVTDHGTVYIYQVTEIKVVEETDMSVILPRGGQTLTLFTCQLGSNDSNNDYSRRHVVYATRIA